MRRTTMLRANVKNYGFDLRFSRKWEPCSMRFSNLLLVMLSCLTADGQTVDVPGSGRISTDWLQTPSSNLSSAGAKTITLTPCPVGVDTTSGWYYVFIAGEGTPEAT